MASSTPIRISLLYTIYFLWFEPLAALVGTYLTLFQPTRFLSGTVPVPAFSQFYASVSESQAITPLMQMLLTNIGSLYVLLAVNEGITLRVTRERAVWYSVVCGMIMSDIGHLYAAYAIAPARASEFLAWNSDEWINYGTLTLGLALRVAFMMGFGRN
ncbi:hypothetical protein BGZ60DRAFT_178137 [Tricladium varicosporioides]|nr:hypothetical protein BGZ60DRAFT_178137 [Hymenoscyphus varicosporioides]